MGKLRASPFAIAVPAASIVTGHVLALFRLSFAFALVTVFAHAQSSWTAVSSPTRQNLWGICHGAGQFVAVGENGTILTSPDGLAWTPRASGTTAWLTSVTHNLGYFLAVGETGTVLRSRDSIAWEQFPSQFHPRPTVRLNVAHAFDALFLIYGAQNAAVQARFPNRLNWFPERLRAAGPEWRAVAHGLGRVVVGGDSGIAVAERGSELDPAAPPAVSIAETRNISALVFARDSFTAVGGEGAIFTSTNAVQWSRQESGTTAHLRAVAAFNNTLVAAGERGTILAQDELGRWQRRTSPTSELLAAAAASETAAVIVGAKGTILHASPTPLAPAIVSAPTSVVETLGGAASFFVGANGSAPLSYQWHRNGSALPGETRATLTRAPLTATDAGNYTVTVSNPTGSATSSVATLNLLPAPAPIVDETFRAAPSLDGVVTALLPLPDGSIVVATRRTQTAVIPTFPQSGTETLSRVLKLRPDGTLDPSWPEHVFATTTSQLIAEITQLRLQPDGKILAGGSFAIHNAEPRAHLLRLNADGTLDRSFVPATEAVARPISDLALQPDARLLVANNGPVPLRLQPDGSLDPSFAPAPLPAAEVPGSSGLKRERLIRHVSVAGEKIYVAGTANLQITLIQGFVPDSMLVRLGADGAVDPAFPTLQWAGNILGLRALSDSLVLIRDAHRGQFMSATQARVERLQPNGTPFPGHLAPMIPRLGRHYIYPDGQVLYFAAGQTSPVRLTALGAPDANFTGGIGSPSAFAVTAEGRILVGGDFSVYNGKPANRVARLHATSNETLNPPRLVTLAADRHILRIGETVTVRATVTGSADLTYEWTPNVTGTVRTTSPTFSFSPVTYGSGSTAIRLTVYNPRGAATAAPLYFTVLPDPPAIVDQPTRVSTQSGRDVTLRVDRNPDAGPTETEWRHNGRLLARTGEPWEDGQTLYLRAVTPAQAGAYTLTVRNQLGVTVTSAPIVLAVDETSRLANLSTRAHVSPGRPLIAGFTLGGSERNRHQLLLRGIGRGLARFGVTDPLADPQLLLYRGQAEWNPGNRDWDSSAPEFTDTLRAAFASVGAFPLEPGSKDAAALGTLDTGGYTVHVTDEAGASGSALVELYETDNDSAPLLNLSSRATVAPAAPMIAGFSIQGRVPKRVLLRAAGPALAAFAVSDSLANPHLELRDAAGRLVATNDDWSASPDAADLAATAPAVGAFPFALASRDAALLITLAPGNYTAHLTSADTTSGSALIEIYDAP